MVICELHREHFFLYCCTYSALHSNGSYPIVACVFVVTGMCLPSRFPAAGVHVSILSSHLFIGLPYNLLFYRIFLLQNTCILLHNLIKATRPTYIRLLDCTILIMTKNFSVRDRRDLADAAFKDYGTLYIVIRGIYFCK
jgi:hypothetical protein